MKLKIGDDLRTVHTVQLFFLIIKAFALTPTPDDVILARSEICETDGDHQNIKIVVVPFC